jgi:hypothetical protein
MSRLELTLLQALELFAKAQHLSDLDVIAGEVFDFENDWRWRRPGQLLVLSLAALYTRQQLRAAERGNP